MLVSNKDLRFSSLFPEEKRESVTIVGLGGIGSHLIQMLLKMGNISIVAYDYDVVEEHNIGTQEYRFQDIGKNKVDVWKERAKDYGARITGYPERVTKDTAFGTTFVFSAVDTISARKDIFKAFLNSPVTRYLIDGRMAALKGQVFRVDKENDIEVHSYEKTIDFSDADTDIVREPCTARATVFCGSVIAGYMAAMYMGLCTKRYVPNKIEFSLITYTKVEEKWT